MQDSSPQSRQVERTRGDANISRIEGSASRRRRQGSRAASRAKRKANKGTRLPFPQMTISAQPGRILNAGDEPSLEAAKMRSSGARRGLVPVLARLVGDGERVRRAAARVWTRLA